MHELLDILKSLTKNLDQFTIAHGDMTYVILMAIVFAVHGLTQIVFAVRVRRFEGWGWFLGSGCVALIAAGLLLLKLPYGHTFTPATIGGVSLLWGGWAYVAVALASRRSS